MPTDEQLRKAFQVFDKDGSGTLTADELVAILTHAGGSTPFTEEDARQVLEKFDTNGDGELQYEEFVEAFGTIAHNLSASSREESGVEWQPAPEPDTLEDGAPKQVLRAASPEFMTWLLNKLVALGAEGKELSTHDAVHGLDAKFDAALHETTGFGYGPPTTPACIRALTLKGRTSLYYFITQHPAGSPLRAELEKSFGSEWKGRCFGRATHFLSHCWGCKFKGFLNSLTEVPEGSYVWNDIFAINQHGDAGPMARAAMQADLASLQKVIQHTKRLVLYFTPLPSKENSFTPPEPLRRVWCLYEILTLVNTKGYTFNLGFESKERAELQKIAVEFAKAKDPKAATNNLRTQTAKLNSAIDSFDAKKGRATVPADQEMILAKIAKFKGGYTAFNNIGKQVLNTALQSFIRTATVISCCKRLAAAKGKQDAQAAAVDLQAALTDAAFKASGATEKFEVQAGKLTSAALVPLLDKARESLKRSKDYKICFDDKSALFQSKGAEAGKIADAVAGSPSMVMFGQVPVKELVGGGLEAFKPNLLPGGYFQYHGQLEERTAARPRQTTCPYGLLEIHVLARLLPHTKLKSLALIDCFDEEGGALISKAGAAELGKGIAGCTTLTSIDLYHSLSMAGWIEIFDALCKNPQNKIATLQLSLLGIRENVMPSLAAYMTASSSLTRVNLQGEVKYKYQHGDRKGQWTEDATVLLRAGGEALAKGVAACKSLTEINLKDCNLGPEGAKAIGEAIRSNKANGGALQLVELTQNGLDVETAVTLAQISRETGVSLWETRAGRMDRKPYDEGPGSPGDWVFDDRRFTAPDGIIACAAADRIDDTYGPKGGVVCLNLRGRGLAFDSERCLLDALDANLSRAACPLQKLGLSRNTVGIETVGVVVRALATSLSGSLTALDMIKCGLDDASARVLADGIAKGSSLVDVDVSENHAILGDGAHALAAAVAANLRIERYCDHHLGVLRQNTHRGALEWTEQPGRSGVVAGMALAAFLPLQGPNGGLKGLNLQEANLCGVWTEKDAKGLSGDMRLMAPTVLRGVYEGATAIAIADALNPELHPFKAVDTRGNLIRGEAATRLSAAVLALPTVEIFNGLEVKKWREDKQGSFFKGDPKLGIGVEGAVALASLLPSAPSLTTLDLGRNALCGPVGECNASPEEFECTGVAALAQAIAASTTLTDIDLQSNNLRAEGAKLLAEAIKTNRSLTKVNLTDNKIDEEGLKLLADAGREGLAMDLGEQDRAAKEYANHVNDTMAAMLR